MPARSLLPPANVQRPPENPPRMTRGQRERAAGMSTLTNGQRARLAAAVNTPLSAQQMSTPATVQSSNTSFTGPPLQTSSIPLEVQTPAGAENVSMDTPATVPQATGPRLDNLPVASVPPEMTGAAVIHPPVDSVPSVIEHLDDSPAVITSTDQPPSSNIVDAVSTSSAAPPLLTGGDPVLNSGLIMGPPAPDGYQSQTSWPSIPSRQEISPVQQTLNNTQLTKGQKERLLAAKNEELKAAQHKINAQRRLLDKKNDALATAKSTNSRTPAGANPTPSGSLTNSFGQSIPPELAALAAQQDNLNLLSNLQSGNGESASNDSAPTAKNYTPYIILGGGALVVVLLLMK